MLRCKWVSQSFTQFTKSPSLTAWPWKFPVCHRCNFSIFVKIPSVGTRIQIKSRLIPSENSIVFFREPFSNKNSLISDLGTFFTVCRQSRYTSNTRAYKIAKATGTQGNVSRKMSEIKNLIFGRVERKAKLRRTVGVTFHLRPRMKLYSTFAWSIDYPVPREAQS